VSQQRSDQVSPDSRLTLDKDSMTADGPGVIAASFATLFSDCYWVACTSCQSLQSAGGQASHNLPATCAGQANGGLGAPLTAAHWCSEYHPVTTPMSTV